MPRIYSIANMEWTSILKYPDDYEETTTNSAGAFEVFDLCVFRLPSDSGDTTERVEELEVTLPVDNSLDNPILGPTTLDNWSVDLIGIKYSPTSGELSSCQISEDYRSIEEVTSADSVYSIDLLNESNSTDIPAPAAPDDEQVVEVFVFGGEFFDISESEFASDILIITETPEDIEEPITDPLDPVWDRGRLIKIGYRDMPLANYKMELDYPSTLQARGRYFIGYEFDGNGNPITEDGNGDPISPWTDWEIVGSDFMPSFSTPYQPEIQLNVFADEQISPGESVLNVTTTSYVGATPGVEIEGFGMGLSTGPPPQPSSKGLVIGVNTDETSGAKYRKISLTGLPLSDSKPQSESETDIEKEETHVDALTLDLAHSTTDIYVPVPSSDLVLSVRRNATSATWNRYNGLLPGESPLTPFGPGWSSNLTSYVVLNEQTNAKEEVVAGATIEDRKQEGSSQDSPNTATVIDENGSPFNFFINYGSSTTGSNPISGFTPTHSDRTQLSSYLVTLTQGDSMEQVLI